MPLFVHLDGQVSERCPVADQHVEVRHAARKQVRQIARQRGVRRRCAAGHREPLRAKRQRPVQKREHTENHHKRRLYPAGRPSGVFARKVALADGERHGKGLMVAQRGRDRAADHSLADGEAHVVLDHIAVVPAGERRIALKGSGKRDGKIVVVDRPVPFGRQQRQGQRLDLILLGDKPGDCIENRKGPAAGEAAVGR